MSEWRQEDGQRWRKLAPLGAEVDADLAAPLAPAAEARLTRLLWEHGLILARGQTLSMERQREICALFGPILIRAGENGYLSTESGQSSALAELSWHADAAYTRAPFDAIALHAVDVVDEASSTLFVSAEDALQTLPADLRDALEGAELDMISPDFASVALRSCDRPDPTALKRGTLPAIHTNPHNGRPCLWASELQTARVIGMKWEQSRALLHAVFAHLYRPEAVLEHRWRTGDIVIWDNIALQHHRPPLDNCGKRVLQRVIVGTEGVAPHMPA
jgi:taurine dioxygenase